MVKGKAESHESTGFSVSTEALDLVFVVLNHSKVEFTGTARSSHLCDQRESVRSCERYQLLSGGVLDIS